MADITKIKPLGSTTEYTLNARILGQTSSTTATDKGGLTWNNISGKQGTTINAYDTPSTTDTWWYILRNRHTNTTNNYYTDVAIPFNANSIYYKRVTGSTGSETIANASTNNGWVQVLDQLNYNNYAPTKEGVGASGTWDINITGTAAKATNDSDGNAINTTYLKKSGGTMTGNINRYYASASADPMITALANNQDITLFTVGHGTAVGATTASNHYKLLYKGTGSSPNNYLQLIAHGSADKVAIQIDENANVSFTNKITANISGNAETVTVTKTTPTDKTTYYPVYTTSTTTGAQSLRNDTRFYYYDTGTTSYLNIGNTSNSGGLTLHNANGKLGDIISSAFTANRTFTLPDKTGTFALTSDLNHILHIELTNEDLNTINPNDVTYYFGGGSNTCTNKPSGVTSFGMVVYRIATGYKMQELTTSGGVIWRRIYDGTNQEWKDWYQGDNVVKQNAVTASSYSNWRPLIIGASSSATEGFNPSTTTDEVYTVNTLTVQPSTGTIRASVFKGNLSGTATNANYLNLYEARGTTTTLNKTANYVTAGAMFHLVATSSTSTTDNGKPPMGDANVLQMNWDNNGGYDAQLAISTAANRMEFRDQISTKKAWREVVTSTPGTTAGGQYLPVYISTTGVATAVTANSVLTDLASTTGASTYAASPRPGVTGTLPVAHGGTGKTTELEAITNLGGIYWKIQGNLISNVDLNTYNATNNKLGTYYSNNSSNTTTLTNSPISGSGFKFLALGGYGTARGHQIAWGTTSTPYLRTETGTGGTFTNWAKLVYNNTGAAVGGTSTPIYVTADGETKEITILSIDHGGTGATTIDEAANNLQVWYLGSGGTAINSSTDLNTLTAIGNYYCGTTGKAKTCLNTPWGNSSSKAVAFILKISDGTGSGTSYLRQELIPYNAIHRWIRWSTDSGANWQPWKSIGSSIYQSTTIADDTPATLSFITHQTDNNIETVASIKVYDDHDAASNGTNMVFRSGGQMVIGSGESPTYLYDTVLKGTTGERMWVTSDSDVRIYSNCNTIANRIGIQVGTSGQLVPIKSETANSYAQDLGSDTARWKTGYIGAFTIGGGDADSIPSRTITSASTFYINRPASTSVIFQTNGVNKVFLDPNNALRPETNNTLSIGTSSYKWKDMYATTFHGALDGNASTATKWETARTLTIGYKGQTVDGSADVTWDLHDILKSNTNISTATSWDQTTPGVYYVSSSAAYTGTSNPESNTKDGTAGLYRYGQLIVSKAANGGLAQFYIAHNDSADNNKYGIHFRTGWNGNYLAKWRQLIDSGNYTNWTVTKTGDGASGEWAISITGNAATATGISTTGGTTAKFWRGDNTWSSELTDKLTVKYLTISSTAADEHLKFSRTNNPNYIIAPLTSDSLLGSIAIGSSTSQRSFRITKDDISPYDDTATATSRLGTQALPWKELFILSQSSSANTNGIQFSDKTAVKGRLGVNTSGGVGLYGADSIYIRPSLTASDIGLIIKTDKTVVPGADSSHSLGSTSLHWQHGYYDDLFVSTNTTYTATNSAVAGTTIGTGQIDITGNPPKIQLHRGNAAAVSGTISSETAYGIQLKGVASATGAPVYIDGTVGSTGITYNSRTIKPMLYVNGPGLFNSSVETKTCFLNNTNGGTNTGYYLYGHNTTYGRLYISTLGTAAVSDGAETPTYTNTTGEVILELGNSKQGTSGNSASVVDNARGRIRFYGTGTKYTDLIPAQTGTNGNYTQYLPQASGYHQVNNSTVATSMSPSNWTIANWNMSGEYYIPGVNAVGVGQLSDVARLKRRIYAAASSNGYSDLYLGNNIPQGTAGNAYGGIVLYGTGAYYTYLRAQPNTANRNCYLPNYAGDTYLAHTANNNAVGDSNTPVYVAKNGRLTACSSLSLPYGATLPSSGTEGDVYLQTSAEYYELPTGGAIGQVLAKKTAADRSVEWINLPVTGINTTSSSSKFYPLGTTSSSNGTINTAAFNSAVYVENNVLFGAAWNDYAEFRQPIQEQLPTPGMCVVETGNDTLEISTKRMQPGAAIVSDTYGFAIGKQNKAICPIAVSGRVLAYPYEDREEFKKNIGRPVCAGPNGTVSIMTDEEYRNYGYCAIGTISAVPNYGTWGENNIPVNNRVWIKVR